MIDRTMRFDFSPVCKRYLLDHRGTMEEARRIERELKRFLVLRALNPSIHYGMTGKVDDMWHTFILFTRDYARFCKEIAGTFLHHDPGVEIDARAADGFRTSYANLFKDYWALFGENPPASVWPTLAEIRISLERGKARGRSRRPIRKHPNKLPPNRP